jgi:hypothetical protein
MEAEERELAATLGSGRATAGDSGGFTPQVVDVTMSNGSTSYRIGTRTFAGRDALRDAIRPLPKEPGVVVRVADDVTVEGAASALQACRDAGFTRIAYQPSAASSQSAPASR